MPDSSQNGAPLAPAVTRRRMPYPFRAMLAICSDLDETRDREQYVETLRLLNARGRTPYGDGLGLEIGNTVYFDMPPDQFAYWNTDDRGRAEIHALIQSGHIDCLHSFGDLATHRSHAARALDALSRHDCRLSVWIDHAVAPTNFGADIMHGEGDVPGAPAYHADLTHAFGVRYVWRGRVTSVIGQSVRRRLGGILNPADPRSAVTLAREAAKGWLAAAGSQKYRMHASNALLHPAQLRDGTPVIEFLRSNPHPGGVSCGDNATGIGDVLTPDVLDRLVQRGATSIVYTHLGKTGGRPEPFTPGGLAALRRLGDAQESGRILVTTTHRLLEYAHVSAALRWHHRQEDGVTRIDVTTQGLDVTRDGALDGLTFHVHDPARVRLFIDDCEQTAALTLNPPDESGRPSVSLPWRRLEFPSL